MANRQALRDLQTRLAQRLQAARANTAVAAHWLAVEIGGRNYLLPLAQAGEIFAWSGVQRVPYTQDWFLGVANLRGSLVGVVDVCPLLGHAVERTDVSLTDASLLALNPSLQVNVALVVDRLMGLRGAQDLQPATAAANPVGLPVSDAARGATYVDSAGAQWQVLQLQQLAQQPEFLNIRV